MSDEEWTDRERWEGIARDIQGETVERIAAVLEQTANNSYISGWVERSDGFRARVAELEADRDRLAGAGEELAEEAMKAHRYCLAHGFDYLNKALGRWKEALAAGRGEGAG